MHTGPGPLFIALSKGHVQSLHRLWLCRNLGTGAKPKSNGHTGDNYTRSVQASRAKRSHIPVKVPCSPHQSSVSYGNPKRTKHALKVQQCSKYGCCLERSYGREKRGRKNIVFNLASESEYSRSCWTPSSITKQLNQMQIRILPLTFHRLPLV